jgi:hypothetical protein
MNKIAGFCKHHYGKALAVAGSVPALSTVARADLLTDTQTAIAAAAADGLTVGGYVIAGVCSLLVIGLIIGIAHKMR